ncbi:SDR family NAD(P)-dependent oxidoreductase [Rapidithrix thailandica]|uniref:SDR family NAD(P)-dependent oxidoreductase n=1 Tax=Rapidithrix thailandica TaxID=413964 RepID=A0AAW9SGM1_9BACT
MKNFERKRVLVTGAAAGIGFGICKAFAEAGATVGLNDIHAKLAEEAATKINDQLQRLAVYPLGFDVSNVPEMQQAFQEFYSLRGGIDVFVANAGITSYESFLSSNPDDFDKIVSVNLRGSFFTAQAAAKIMIRQPNPGKIIFMSSVTGLQAHKNLTVYGLTKAGIRMMTKSLALELGEYGINVNAVGAGATLTERTLELDPEYEEKWNGVTPIGRTATVEDIAHTVMFLASEEARHITGETIMVDGGWTIHSPLPND